VAITPSVVFCAAQLKDTGIHTIIQYITISTQSKKCVKPSEAKAIAAAVLKLSLVFEIWGGSKDFSRGDINADGGERHGLFASDWTAEVGAPDGTIIWFAIDNDVNEDQFVRFVRPYFAAVKRAWRANIALAFAAAVSHVSNV